MRRSPEPGGHPPDGRLSGLRFLPRAPRGRPVAEHCGRSRSSTGDECSAHGDAEPPAGPVHAAPSRPPSWEPTMRAAVITALTGPDTVEVRNVPDPVPEPGQVLIDVA